CFKCFLKKLSRRIYYKNYYLLKNLFLYIYKFKKKLNIFSMIFLKFFKLKYKYINYNKKNNLNKISNVKFINNKYIKRSYHSSNFCFDFVIDILKSLAKKEDNMDKRRLRLSYKKLIKKLSPIDEFKNRFISYKNMPSRLLKRTFNISKKKNVRN